MLAFSFVCNDKNSRQLSPFIVIKEINCNDVMREKEEMENFANVELRTCGSDNFSIIFLKENYQLFVIILMLIFYFCNNNLL